MTLSSLFRTMRQSGLKLLVGIVRLVVRDAPAGWRRSRRPVELRRR